MRSFIVSYDRNTGKADVEEFPENERAKAIKRFMELGDQHNGHPNIQVNLVEAIDRADLEKHNLRWFHGQGQ
jgi:hypothetical protein